MSKEQEIRDGFRRMAEKEGPLQTLLAEVVSVDENEMTCVIKDDELEIFDVRLRPVINGKKSFTLYPKVGCYVLAARIEDGEEWMVIAVDEIEKFELTNGDVSLKEILTDLVDEVIKVMAPKNVAALTLIKTQIAQLLK